MVDLSSVWVFYNLSVGAPETINVKGLETLSTVVQPESTTMVGLLCNIYCERNQKYVLSGWGERRDIVVMNTFTCISDNIKVTFKHIHRLIFPCELTLGIQLLLE